MLGFMRPKITKIELKMGGNLTYSLLIYIFNNLETKID
jgi:hypothetical protein